MFNNKIYLDLNNFFRYTSSKTIKILDFKDISINLILDIVNNYDTLNTLINILKNKEILDIEFYFTNQKNYYFKINKIEFFQAILKLINEGIIILNEYFKYNLIEIFKVINYTNYQYENKNHIFLADNQEFVIPVSKYFDFLILNENDFLNYSKEGLIYEKIPNNYFLYGLIKYFEEESLFQKYLFSINIINRIKKIKQMDYIDFESVNKFLEIKDPWVEKIKLDEKLEEELLKEKDKFSNIFDYLIFLYLKICKIFVYDTSVYATKQKGGRINEHADIFNIKKITLSNNEIVCYEFTAIFSYFLNKLGIKYELKQKSSEYGQVHNYLIFRYNEFIIQVDAVMAIVESDLTNVKIGSKIIGLVCLNKNPKTREDFVKRLESLYKPKNHFENTLKELTVGNTFLEDVKRNLSLIVKKINDLELSYMDAVAYFLRLNKNVFSKEDKFFSTVIKDNTINWPKPIIVMAINKISVLNTDNIYFIYEYPHLKEIKKEELEDKFFYDLYEYRNEKLIPGIDLTKKRLTR